MPTRLCCKVKVEWSCKAKYWRCFPIGVDHQAEDLSRAVEITDPTFNLYDFLATRDVDKERLAWLSAITPTMSHRGIYGRKGPETLFVLHQIAYEHAVHGFAIKNLDP